MKVVRYKLEKDIAWLAMNNPPLNALSHALRAELVQALHRAVADPKVRAVVIIGNERAFSSGADIKEFAGGAFYADPFLPAVVDIVEGASKPVIAAISGACMGGGLELALGCHYRVARADAKIAFPEVKLGLIPGAGGTQRFPRLVGLEARAQHDRVRSDRSRVHCSRARRCSIRSPKIRSRMRRAISPCAWSRTPSRSGACAICRANIRRRKPSCSSPGPASPPCLAALRRRRARSKPSAQQSHRISMRESPPSARCSANSCSARNRKPCAMRSSPNAPRRKSPVSPTRRHSARSRRLPSWAPAPWAAASR